MNTVRAAIYESARAKAIKEWLVEAKALVAAAKQPNPATEDMGRGEGGETRMSREIKFRGKRIDNGEWVCGSLIETNVIVDKIVEFTEEYFCTEWWCKVDPETVGQYTGLKDKNGRQIWEGDIIQTQRIQYSSSGQFAGMSDHIGSVVFNDGRFALRMESGAIPDLGFGLSFHEVIGNVHDNPELLEGGATK